MCKMFSKTVCLSNICKTNRFIFAFNKIRKVSTSAAKDEILLENAGTNKNVITLGMNRPNAKNALSKNMLSLFGDALESVKCDKNARVLVIHSLVKNIFCAGADLKERATMPEEEVGPFVAKIRQLFLNLINFPLPIIAAIDGPALGGGLEMALGCDLRVSSTTTKMGLVETKLGIIPGGGGTQLLPRIVGPSIAKEMIFTGRIIDGSEAHKIGLVSAVVDQNVDGNAAFLKAIDLADEISFQGPIAIRLAKQAINRGLDVDLYTGLLFEQACYAQVIGTKDRIEGLMAFKEKRPPKFQGH